MKVVNSLYNVLDKVEILLEVYEMMKLYPVQDQDMELYMRQNMKSYINKNIVIQIKFYCDQYSITLLGNLQTI